MPLGDLATPRCVVGARQVYKKLLMGELEKVFLARDADPSLVQPILIEAQRQLLTVEWADSMKLLGRACAVQCKAAAAGIRKA